MPVYAYRCNACTSNFKVFHGTEEQQDKCIICGSNDFKKSFLESKPNIKNNTNSDDVKKRVEGFIEESRETLKQQLEEARREIK